MPTKSAPTPVASDWRRRTLWPTLAALAALPPLGACALVFMFWLVHLWNVPPWAVAAGSLAVAAMGAGVVWLAARSAFSRRLHFGLRAMFVATTVLALACALVVRASLTQTRRAIALRDLIEAGGAPEAYPTSDADWLEREAGFDPFKRIDTVRLGNAVAVDVLLASADAYPHLEQVSFSSGWGATDRSLARMNEFNAFPRLEFVALYGPALGDAALRHASACEVIEEIFVNGLNVTDDGLACLKDLPSLRSVSLFSEGPRSRMAVTDAGMN